MNLARYKKCEELGYNVKEDGLSGAPKLCCFASSDAHYSVTKAASLLGIGWKNIIRIEVDAQGKMLNKSLSEAVVKAKADG
jgi:glutamate/tyrosine decarboxylase-like PLP-dependent enzyme